MSCRHKPNYTTFTYHSPQNTMGSLHCGERRGVSKQWRKKRVGTYAGLRGTKAMVKIPSNDKNLRRMWNREVTMRWRRMWNRGVKRRPYSEDPSGHHHTRLWTHLCSAWFRMPHRNVLLGHIQDQRRVTVFFPSILTSFNVQWRKSAVGLVTGLQK